MKITLTKKNEDRNRVIQLYINPKLSIILGFDNKEESGRWLRFDEEPEFTAKYLLNLFLLTPRNIIATCNIVDETVFGAQSLKLLRLVPKI